MLYLIQYIFYLIPIAAIVFFIISMVRFLSARSVNKAAPGTFDMDELRRRKLLLIVSSVIAGVLAAVVIIFAILLFTAVAFM